MSEFKRGKVKPHIGVNNGEWGVLYKGRWHMGYRGQLLLVGLNQKPNHHPPRKVRFA